MCAKSAQPFSRHSFPQIVKSVITFCGDVCTCALVKAFFCQFCSPQCERACFRSLDHFGVATMPFETATATKVATYAYSTALKPSKVLWHVNACVKGNESREHSYLGPYGSTLTHVVVLPFYVCVGLFRSSFFLCYFKHFYLCVDFLFNILCLEFLFKNILSY